MATYGKPGTIVKCNECGAFARCKADGEIRPHRKEDVEGNVMCYG